MRKLRVATRLLAIAGTLAASAAFSLIPPLQWTSAGARSGGSSTPGCTWRRSRWSAGACRSGGRAARVAPSLRGCVFTARPRTLYMRPTRATRARALPRARPRVRPAGAEPARARHLQADRGDPPPRLVQRRAAAGRVVRRRIRRLRDRLRLRRPVGRTAYGYGRRAASTRAPASDPEGGGARAAAAAAEEPAAGDRGGAPAAAAERARERPGAATSSTSW